MLTDDSPICFRAHELTKTYISGENEVHALRGVSVDIPQGELVVMLGPSGSGKSTFLNIVGGLDQPSYGQIYFEGKDLAKVTNRQLTYYRRESVGFVFQAYNLVPSLTALENISLVTEISPNPMEPLEALDIVGLRGRENHFPSQLSGGEQQRVAIARALAKQPKVLLCDEPTGALDSKTGVMVLDALMKVNREFGTTCIIITHNASIARLADRVIHFCDGKITDITTNNKPATSQDIDW